MLTPVDSLSVLLCVTLLFVWRPGALNGLSVTFKRSIDWAVELRPNSGPAECTSCLASERQLDYIRPPDIHPTRKVPKVRIAIHVADGVS